MCVLVWLQDRTPKRGPKKNEDTCLKGIGLCTQNMIVNLGSMFNIFGGGRRGGGALYDD